MKSPRLFLASLGRRTINSPAVTFPLGILSLAAYVRQKFDLDIQLMDQRAENCGVDEVVMRAVAFEAEVVGFHCLTPAGHTLGDLTRKIRRALPRALIVLGGPHVSAFGSQAMANTDANAVVIGEGEWALEQILRAHIEGGGFGHIPGLIWRDSGGGIIANPGCTPLIDDLDALPFPAYDLIDLRPYWRLRSMTQVPPHRYMTILSSRGCPYKCIYCHRIFGKEFRAQSPERTVSEIEHYAQQFDVRDIEFVDDIFNHDPRRVTEFSELVRKRNLKIDIAFPNALRCDELTQDLVDALADAGAYYAACALESGSPRVQAYMGKRLNIPRFLRSVEMLADRGVLTNGFTMLGFPTETEEEMLQTIAVTCASRLHTATFFTVTPYPNTELYDLVIRTHPEKLANLTYEDTDYTGIAVNLADVPDEVLFACQRKAWRRFYLNPRRIARIIRRYPRPLYLPCYLPQLALRLAKGLF